ncbi:MAG: molybdopterin molybdenumtransferase MoeA, partial [Deltaproteobacteria bacterium]|nr:molybdopterin molybdenumtransferase MoeA [Deltaproteobacteria bacterium]
AHQLVAQVASAGGVPEYHGIARDHQELLEEAIERAAAGKDLLLLSGGVSRGDFDLVPEVLRARGVRILFDRVRIKPGKPTTFGVGPEGPCFGLPGNPVSTFVIFEILVRPLLQAMTGQPWDPGEWATILHAPVRRRRAERDEWIPVTRTPEGGVVPVSYHGSSHVAALAGSHGLLRVPVGISLLPEGTTVRVRPLPA